MRLSDPISTNLLDPFFIHGAGVEFPSSSRVSNHHDEMLTILGSITSIGYSQNRNHTIFRVLLFLLLVISFFPYMYTPFPVADTFDKGKTYLRIQ